MALATAAAIIYGIADLVFSWNPIAAAPYLAHRREPVFRDPPALMVGFFAEALNGWISSLAFFVLEPALAGSPWRRGTVFGLVVWGFWVFSGTATSFVWLAIPWSLALTNLFFGLLKCLSIGCAIAWCWQAWPARLPPPRSS